jgi:hypothetical protein
MALARCARDQMSPSPPATREPLSATGVRDHGGPPVLVSAVLLLCIIQGASSRCVLTVRCMVDSCVPQVTALLKTTALTGDICVITARHLRRLTGAVVDRLNPRPGWPSRLTCWPGGHAMAARRRTVPAATPLTYAAQRWQVPRGWGIAAVRQSCALACCCVEQVRGLGPRSSFFPDFRFVGGASGSPNNLTERVTRR